MQNVIYGLYYKDVLFRCSWDLQSLVDSIEKKNYNKEDWHIYSVSCIKGDLIK